jgi:hypothetical protein
MGNKEMINPEIFQFNEVTVVKVNIHEKKTIPE